MDKILSDKDRDYIAKLFAKNLKDPVNIMLFTDSEERCETCKEEEQLLRELVDIDKERLKLTVYDISKDKDVAKFFDISKAPALVLGGKKIYDILYLGVPSGYEFAALLEDIIDVSNNRSRLSEEGKSFIRSIDKKIEIKVFVTPTCPYCPSAVRTAHQMALENKNIRAMMIESIEFPELADKYNVMAVPKIVINDKVEFEGAVPENMFIDYIKEAIKE
ncbi:MAG: glutaredoxin [Candidatus Micrarchaeota archaeon]|nr:MAG: glutaredoxin [Candidatus Micrarchaeota archaeon]